MFVVLWLIIIFDDELTNMTTVWKYFVLCEWSSLCSYTQNLASCGKKRGRDVGIWNIMFQQTLRWCLGPSMRVPVNLKTQRGDLCWEQLLVEAVDEALLVLYLCVDWRVAERIPTPAFGDCALLLFFAAGVHVAAASLVLMSEVAPHESNYCCVVDDVCGYSACPDEERKTTRQYGRVRSSISNKQGWSKYVTADVACPLGGESSVRTYT